MMLLQIYFKVPVEKSGDFEKMYENIYVPALRKQQGYIRSDLLRVFPKDMADEIEATPTEYNYQMELVFDTEQNRRKWVASPEHQQAWTTAESMTTSVAWQGYDIMGNS